MKSVETSPFTSVGLTGLRSWVMKFRKKRKLVIRKYSLSRPMLSYDTYCYVSYPRRKKRKDQELIQSSTIPDPTHHM